MDGLQAKYELDDEWRWHLTLILFRMFLSFFVGFVGVQTNVVDQRSTKGVAAGEPEETDVPPRWSGFVRGVFRQQGLVGLSRNPWKTGRSIGDGELMDSR